MRLERGINDIVGAGVKAALILLLSFLAACSSGPRTDLPAIRGMRSAAAEWALVNREAARGRLTPAYTAGMRKAMREEIAKQARTLAPESPEAAAVAALQALPPSAAPGLIMRQAAALKRIEAALESA